LGKLDSGFNEMRTVVGGRVAAGDTDPRDADVDHFPPR